MSDDWTTYDMEKGGQAYWLTRLCTKVVGALRSQGFPEEGYRFRIKVPTLLEQAKGLHVNPAPETSCVRPSGEVSFQDGASDV